MEFSSVRHAGDDAVVEATIKLSTSDIAAAFFNQADPDVQLFYQLFGPVWDHLQVGEKLAVLAKVTDLAEGARATTNEIVAKPLGGITP